MSSDLMRWHHISYLVLFQQEMITCRRGLSTGQGFGPTSIQHIALKVRARAMVYEHNERLKQEAKDLAALIFAAIH